jgi:uncharacterized protein (TIGR02677 family)
MTDPDEGKTHLTLMTLRSRFEELTRRAQSFMSGLQRRIDLQGIDIEEFLAYKQRLLDYLERFIQELIVATAEIAETLSKIEPDDLNLFSKLSRLAISWMPCSCEEERRAAANLKIWEQRWKGLRDWFTRQKRRPFSCRRFEVARSAIWRF